MNTRLITAILAGLVAAFAATGAPAKTCKEDVAWQHEHAKAKAQNLTTNVKGTRATILEVCRVADASGDGLEVGVVFEGDREARPLPADHCFEQFAKWAVIKSRGVKNADGPAKAGGVYRVCKD